MRLITRYILREHIGPLFFAVTTLTSLLLLNYVAKRFDELVGKGLPWNVIGEFFLLSVPFTLAMTLPMAVLIATLYAFSRLASDSEITALLSTGVGARQLMAPVVGAGLVLSLGMVAFNDQLLPRANHRLSSLLASIAQKKPTLALKPQILNEVSPRGLYMWVAQVDQRRNALRGVTIYDLMDVQARRTIVADSAHLAYAQNQTDLLLTLYHGYVEETQAPAPDRLQRTHFVTNILRVADVANELVIDEEAGYKGDREMTVCEMYAEVERARRVRDSTLASLAAVDRETAEVFPARFGSNAGGWYCRGMSVIAGWLSPRQAQAQTPQGQKAQLGGGSAAAGATQDSQPGPVLTPRQLRAKAALAVRPGMPVQSEAIVQAIRGTERRISSFDVEIHKKFAISIACLIFALLGPPIALRFPRSGVGLTIGVSLGVFALYYVGLIAGESLGDDNKVPAPVAMWAANAILAVVAIALASGMGRRGATGRGAEWPPFVERALFRWRTRRSRA